VKPTDTQTEEFCPDPAGVEPFDPCGVGGIIGLHRLTVGSTYG